MGVFRRRPLALLCLIFVLSAVVGWFFVGTVKQILVVTARGVAFALISVYILAKLSAKKRRAILLTAVAFAVCALSVLRSYSYFDAKYLANKKYYGEGRTVRLLVTERVSNGSMSTVYGANVLSIDGADTNIPAIFECNGNSYIQPGYYFEAIGTLGGLENSRSGDERQLLSDGYLIWFLLEDDGDARIIDEKSNIGLSGWLDDIKERLSDRVAGGIGGDGGKLASAVLLGDRGRVPSDIGLAFTRSGITHLLALSGLHVSVLLGGINLLLTVLLVDKKARAVVLAVLSFAYLALTGFSPSACRAVVMADAVYLSWIFKSVSDGVTSVLLAAFMILTVSPTSVASYGFWLSCVAAFGLVLFVPTVSEDLKLLVARMGKLGWLGRILSYILSGLAVGAVATGAVLCLNFLWFGEISYMSVPITLLLSLPMTGLLIFSLLFLVLGRIPIVGQLIAKVARICAELMIKVASDVSDIDGVLLSMRYTAVFIAVVVTTALMILAVAVRFKSELAVRICSYIPIFCTICVLLSAIISSEFDNSQRNLIYASASSQSDRLVMTCGNQGVVCDISTGSTQIAQKTLEIAKSNNLCEIQALMLTGYNTKQPSQLAFFCNRIKVRRLWLPEPYGTDDYYIMKSLIREAETLGIEVTIYSVGDDLTVFGDCTLKLNKSYNDYSKRPIIRLEYKTPTASAEYITPSALENTDVDISHDNLVILSGAGPKLREKYNAELYDGATVIFNNSEIAFAADDSLFVDGNIYILSPEVYKYTFEN